VAGYELVWTRKPINFDIFYEFYEVVASS